MAGKRPSPTNRLGQILMHGGFLLWGIGLVILAEEQQNGAKTPPRTAEERSVAEPIGGVAVEPNEPEREPVAVEEGGLEVHQLLWEAKPIASQPSDEGRDPAVPPAQVITADRQ